MADEKLNVSPEENPQPSLFDAGPEGAPAQDAPTPEPPAPENAPEQTGGEPPAQDAPAGAPGEVSVSADQIEKLMAERRAAGRAEVEKNEPPKPEQPPTPAPEEKAAGEKGPAKKEKAAKEKTPEPDKSKGRRGRKPKEEKAGPGEPGGTRARRGRPAKADKAAPDRPPSQPRDKMSQSKGAKAATVKGKEDAPAAPPPASEAPPQPRDATRAEKEEIVYLNLSELFPFKDHPFGVRDDAEMKGLVESVKDNGVHQPALVRPREGGGYEIIAGHRRQRASELAGFANMPCFEFYPDIETEEDLGRYWAEDLPIPAELKDYFDYGAYGRDVSINDGGHFAPGGYIVQTSGDFKEYYHDTKDIPAGHKVFFFSPAFHPGTDGRL